MRKSAVRTLSIIRVFGMALALCVSALFIWAILTYADYARFRIRMDCSEEVGEYLVQIRETPSSISEVGRLPFPADGFYVVGPYLPEKEQFEVVGTKWYLSTSFMDHVLSGLLSDRAYLDEGRQVLVFVLNDKPVSTAILDRMDGDFLGQDYRSYHVDERLRSDVEPATPTYWRITRAE